MHFQGAGFGAVQTRHRNQNHLKFINPELKLSLVHVARNWNRNQNHLGILLEDGVKVATEILSRSRSCIRGNICKTRYGAGTCFGLVPEPVLVPASSMIEDLLATISVS